MCLKYPSGASFYRNLLFARMPACGRPQTARLISKWMYLLYASSFMLDWLWIHSGNNVSGMRMYSKYYVFCARHADDTIPVEFSSVKVCCAYGRAGLVRDEITPGCNTNPVWIFFVWPIMTTGFL